MNSLPLFSNFPLIPTIESENFLVVNSRNRQNIIPINELVYLEGYGNYTYLYTADGQRYLASKTLKKFADILNATQFIRIHKSSIINLAYLKTCSECNQSVKLKTGKEIAVSRRRARQIYKISHSIQS